MATGWARSAAVVVLPAPKVPLSQMITTRTSPSTKPLFGTIASWRVRVVLASSHPRHVRRCGAELSVRTA